MALFTLGGRFIFGLNARQSGYYLGLLVRLFVVPLIAIFVSVLSALGEKLSAVIVLFGGLLLLLHTMAQQMGGNEQCSSTFSLLPTVFLLFLFLFLSAS